MAYFAALHRLSAPGYLERFFDKIAPDLEHAQALLYRDTMDIQPRRKAYLANRNRVAELLSPKLPLQVYLKPQAQNPNLPGIPPSGIQLILRNNGFIPITLVSLDCGENGGSSVSFTPSALPPKAPGNPLALDRVPSPTIATSGNSSPPGHPGHMSNAW